MSLSRASVCFLCCTFILWFAACEAENCVSVATNDMQVRFYENDSTTSRRVRFRYLQAIGNDSVFYTIDTVALTYSFPLDPERDRTDFALQILDTAYFDTLSTEPLELELVTVYLPPDTLSVEYRRLMRIITEECGVEISYEELRVIRATFPAYKLISEQVSRFDEVNLEVYF